MEENDCHQIVIAYKTYRRVHCSRRCCKKFGWIAIEIESGRLQAAVGTRP
jgi:hypothetical protein